MGLEPTRAEHNRLAVYRLNHSATSSVGSLEFIPKLVSFRLVAVQRERNLFTQAYILLYIEYLLICICVYVYMYFHVCVVWMQRPFIYVLVYYNV